MITEDYVSFETAKLLKEKGFDVKCEYCYAEFSKDDIEVIGLSPAKCAQSLKEDRYPYVTLQMAMKWLREVHKIHITVYPYGKHSCDNYQFDIYKNREYLLSKDEGYITNEQAIEVAIKYCLENLI